MKLTQKGQVTIPHRLRKRYGLTPNTEMVFEERNEGVLLRAVPKKDVKHLSQALATIRGSADAGLSTAAIMEISRD